MCYDYDDLEPVAYVFKYDVFSLSIEVYAVSNVLYQNDSIAFTVLNKTVMSNIVCYFVCYYRCTDKELFKLCGSRTAHKYVSIYLLCSQLVYL